MMCKQNDVQDDDDDDDVNSDINRFDNHTDGFECKVNLWGREAAK